MNYISAASMENSLQFLKFASRICFLFTESDIN